MIKRIRKPTKRMIAAVAFCESVIDGLSFDGNIDSFNEVSAFLNENLDDAKARAEDAVSSYYSNFDY